MSALLSTIFSLSTLFTDQYKSVFDFTVKDIDENIRHLEEFKGNVTLVVNVASYWGLTPLNYQQLQALNVKYRDQGLRILAFPCNQFANQEPGNNTQIKEFVKQYGVTFDMFDKIKVNGDDAIPLFKWLKEKLPGFLINAVKWNFTKFLSDRKGIPYKRYSPKTPPFDIEEEIIELLEADPRF